MFDKHSQKRCTRLHIIDPFAVDFGIAVVSAAAGAASQIPRIQSLERELEITRAALTESEQELVSKITELEEKMFVMDQEFEQQTARFKKQYDQKMKEDLRQVTEKMKTDFKYKLEIKVEEAKAKMLSDKLDIVNNLTGDRQAELMQLRVQRDQIDRANAELEKALEETANELERIRAASEKKGWWPF